MSEETSVSKRGRKDWDVIEDAPRSHRMVARCLIVRPNCPIDIICFMCNLRPRTVQEIIKHPPFGEYVEKKRGSIFETFLASEDLFPSAASEAMLVVDEIMQDEDQPSYARLKAAEILLDRDPRQMYPDRSKQKERSIDTTGIHSTEAVQGIQERGQTMRENAVKKAHPVIEIEAIPVEDTPEDEKPTEVDPDV